MSQIISTTLLKDINPAIKDTIAALVADGINAWVENLTSRSWGDQRTVTERYNAKSVVWLNHMDVVNVVSVKTGYPQQDQTTLESSDYHWTQEGRLVLGGYDSYRSRVSYIEVEYVYGVPDDQIPMDLKMAAVGMALGYVEWLNNSGRNVSRAQVGSYTLEFAGSVATDPTKGGTVTRDIEVVKSYAMRRV
ncbi:hypothetical protein [Mycolicibacterium neoaurum]|uniref:hypothetical protein n=1 Tax=Mycolicibacterium neoaurum TaxID=1795 RepID=UPI001F4C6F55|nr:hypothetical protein [Mycolicibacterium neoaurum]